MEFENKRILVLCKETFSYPLYFLVQKWIKKGNEVAAFFFNPCESMYAPCILNDTTYYAFLKIEGLKIYTSNKIAEEFVEQQHATNILDEVTLSKIEKDYCHFQNVNQQVLSSQFLTRHYHYRNYMQPCTYAQQMNWLVSNYKNVWSIIEDFKPDMVLDFDNAELARCVMREVCYHEGVPYIAEDHPRYEFYKIFTYNLGHHVGELFKKAYERNYSKKQTELSDEYQYVYDFRGKHDIMHAQYKNDVTAQYNPESLWRAFKNVVGMARYFIAQDKAGKNGKLKRSMPLFYPSSCQYIKFYAKYFGKKQILMRKNKYFLPPVEGEKYVYMPLHLIPESTTFTLSPMYINELSIIEAVSKSLPAGWWLYVKEHQAMVGERGIEFYKKANKLPNVKMVQLNYYTDPKPWISKAQGVVTISGTTAYEAALLGKRSVIFADVPFSLIEGITRLRSFEDLPAALKKFTEPISNVQSCAAYIAAVKEMGLPINLKLLVNYGQDIIRGKGDMTEEYQEALDNLEKLYQIAYEKFEEEKTITSD